MLDLDPIKARLDLASGSTHSKWAHIDLVNHAPTDLAALVAEVERLRAAIREHQDETHRKWNIDYGSGRKVSRLYRIASLDEELWEVLHV